MAGRKSKKQKKAKQPVEPPAASRWRRVWRRHVTGAAWELLRTAILAGGIVGGLIIAKPEPPEPVVIVVDPIPVQDLTGEEAEETTSTDEFLEEAPLVASTSLPPPWNLMGIGVLLGDFVAEQLGDVTDFEIQGSTESFMDRCGLQRGRSFSESYRPDHPNCR